MTREEAHRILSNGLVNAPSEHEWCMAFEMAIKALEQEPCEDAISRQEVLDVVNNPLNIRLDEIIKQLPSVNQQEPKTGHWITKIKSDLRGDMWPTNPKCSECGGEPYYSNTIYSYDFCPYCGAKMVKPQESEDKK